MTSDQLKTYLLDNYGSCKKRPCECIVKGDWKGRLCPNWTPAGFQTWEEVFSYAKEQKHAGR